MNIFTLKPPRQRQRSNAALSLESSQSRASDLNEAEEPRGPLSQILVPAILSHFKCREDALHFILFGGSNLCYDTFVQS